MSKSFDDILNDDSVRREFHDGEWLYSAIDLVIVILNLPLKDAQNYYNSLKKRLNREGGSSTGQYKRLKLTSRDGKKYLTEVVNREQALRLIQSISSSNAEAVKLWLAKSGVERLEEIQDPELGLFRSIERAIEYYREQGKPEGWIKTRVEGIITRNKFVEALKIAVLNAPTTIYAEATEKVYRGLWKRTTAQLRGELKINKKQNLRDHFGKYALIYTSLAEQLASDKLGTAEVVSEGAALDIIWEVAKMIHSQAQETSKSLGYDLVKEKPLLSTSSKKKK